MKSDAAFEELLPVQTRENAVIFGARQVMGLAMALSLLAVAIVMLVVVA